MSSQHFDKNIADRLNAVSVPPDPNAWDRISSRLPLPLWLVWFKKYGTITYVVASLGFMASFWLQYQDQKKENDRFQQSFHALKINYEKLNADVAQLRSQSSQTLAMVDQNAGLVKELSVAKNRIRAKKPGQILVAKGDNSGEAYPVVSRSAKSKSEHAAPSGLENKQGSELGIADPGSFNPQNQVPASGLGSTNTNPNPLNNNNLAASSNTLKSDSGNTDTPLANNKPQPDSGKVVQAPDKNRNKKIMDLLKPRIGGEFISNFNEMYGFGASLEFPFGKNLGFSLGILAYQQVSADFESESNFNVKTSKKFREEYADNLKPYTGDFNEITLKTSLIEVPVRFKYYWPLSKSLSVIASIGTHLNMSIRQDIRFETHENNKENYHTFIHRPAPEVFHNIVFSPGIQYQRDNLFLQISPYYQFNYTQIEYLDKPQILGLSCSLWFKP